MLAIKNKNNLIKQSKNLSITYPFGKCKVCFDSATGIHYGIPTCEGCKGFFKRSILKNEIYRCYFGNTCVLTPSTRNRCKACRFKHCLKAGMSLTCIKMGRIPKAIKEKALNQMKSPDKEVSASPLNLETDKEDIDEIDMKEEEKDCIILNEKIRENVIEITRQEVNINNYEAKQKDNNLVESLKNTISNNAKYYNHSQENYNHVYDINHSDDCLAQFLESIDIYVQSPCSVQSAENVSSPFSSEKLTDTESTVNKEKIINPCNIEIKSKFLSIYMQMTHENIYSEPSYKITCSLLNDKIYQLYIETTKKINENLKKEIQSVEANDFSQFHNATLEDIWNGLIEFVPRMVKMVISFAKEIPGLNELSPKDFTTLINNRLFDTYILIHSDFYIKGESYLRLGNNAHYSRYWMNKVKGKHLIDNVFEFAESLNALEMTVKEKSLLIPLVITMHDENIEDLSTLHVLNEYYTRAILYEFDLNKRDNSFIIDLSKVIGKLKHCKQIKKMANLNQVNII